MKNSRFEDEILKRLKDPNWDTYISETVKEKFNSKNTSWFTHSNLEKAAVVLFFLGIGWGIFYQISNHYSRSDLELTNSQSRFSPLTNADIRDLDLLLENDEIKSEYLLTGFIEIQE